MLRHFRTPLFNIIRGIHENLKVGILGVPFEKGQPRVGVGNGPKAIRDASLIERITSIDDTIDIKDYGDVEYSIERSLQEVEQIENMKEYEHVAACSEEVSKNVEKIILDGRVPVTLGGDHSVGVGTVDGHIKATDNHVSVLWIDAHADLNTNKTSSSGNIHGMSLSLLVKEFADYWPYLPGMDWQKPVLPLRRIAYIGLRDIDIYERLLIDKQGIVAFNMEDVDKYGIHNVVTMAVERIDPEETQSYHISFDIDALDPLEAPSTGTTVRGGLTLREGIHIVETVASTGRLGALDLVEVNPSIGSVKDVDKTVDAAVHIIMASLGSRRKGMRLKRVNEIPRPNLNNTKLM